CTLSGVEGKLFRPLVHVVVLDLVGLLIFSFTFVPAVASWLLGGGIAGGESRVMRAVHRSYVPVLARGLRRRRLVVLLAGLWCVVAFLAATRLGAEIIPTLDEQDILVMMPHMPGTGLVQTLDMESGVEQAIAQFPEVATVFGQIGTGDVASDPMPPNAGDIYVILKPRKHWPKSGKPKEQLIRE